MVAVRTRARDKVTADRCGGRMLVAAAVLCVALLAGLVEGLERAEREEIRQLARVCGGSGWWRTFFCGEEIDFDCWDGFDVDPCDLSPFVTCDVSGAHVLELNLSSQGLACEFPGALRGLPRLQKLDLSDNDVSGRLPAWMADLRSLEHLALHDNFISGPVFPVLGQLGGLKYVSLAGNPLGTSLDGNVCAWSGLRELLLSNASLAGPLPGCVSSLTSLERVDLSLNLLSGPFPALERVRALAALEVQENAFEGPFPLLSASAPVVLLNVSGNQFRGAVPDLYETISVLDVSRNHLQCPIPEYVGQQEYTCECAPGFLPHERAGECVACPPGTFYVEAEAEADTNALCTPCVSGTFQAQEGALMCDACGAGDVSMPGSSFCEPCPEHWQPAATGGECEACAVGWYRVQGMGSCAPCAENGARCTGGDGGGDGSDGGDSSSPTPTPLPEASSDAGAAAPPAADDDSAPAAVSGNLTCAANEYAGGTSGECSACPSVTFGGACGTSWQAVVAVSVPCAAALCGVVIGGVVLFRRRGRSSQSSGWTTAPSSRTATAACAIPAAPHVQQAAASADPPLRTADLPARAPAVHSARSERTAVPQPPISAPPDYDAIYGAGMYYDAV